MTQPLLEGLADPALGPRRQVTVRHRPTIEVVSHGCMECGTRHSHGWFSMPVVVQGQTVDGPVCASCWGVEYHELHPTTEVICSACGSLLRRIPEGHAVLVDHLAEYHAGHLLACGGRIEVRS